VNNVPPLDAAALPDLSEDAPAGENLELDPDFDSLERAAQGRPETQYGDTINPAIPADWKATETIALGLLERTRDLRVMTHLAVARLHLSGVPGFAGVLAQIRHQLEQRWQQVHPRLDPEDDNDPTLRANALFRLQDPANVLRTLRDLPLASSPMTGVLTWRELAVFRGAAEPEPGREKPSEAFIRGAFQKTDPERLRVLRQAVEQAANEIAMIPMVFEANAGAGTGPNFSNLTQLLNEIRKDLERFEPVPIETALPFEEAIGRADLTEPAVVQETAPRTQPLRAGLTVRSIAAISSREDALHVLELASAYFRASEPSSPVPMLIDRARRLAAMDFMDILRDLAPDGLGQAQIVAGPVTE
jgi:type VI secretion system protein ImpA